MIRPHLVLFGFPVRFGSGAMIIAGLAVFYLQLLGLALAAVFLGSVLIHELGHAFAFRRYGCSSAIVLNAFGGYTVSHDAHKLTHREQVKVSAAGPLVQLGLLGVPSLFAWWFLPVSGIAQIALPIYVLLNVGWALVNLLPLYPLDGGQILLHELLHRNVANAWHITKWVAIGVGVPAALFAVANGFLFGALFIGYTVWQGISTGGPRAARSGNDPVRTAVQRANTQHTTLNTSGEVGDALVAEASQKLASGGHRRFTILVDALETEPTRSADVERLRGWEAAIVGDTSDAPPDGSLLSQTLAVVNGGDPVSLRQMIAAAPTRAENVLSIALLSRHDRLTDTLTLLDAATLESLADQAVDAGMLPEQLTIRRALEAGRPNA